MLAFAETSTIASPPATVASTTAAITRQARPRERRISDASGGARVGVGAGIGAGGDGRSVGGRRVGSGGVGGSAGARSGENVGMSQAL